jgi:hypothetical protein
LVILFASLILRIMLIGWLSQGEADGGQVSE